MTLLVPAVAATSMVCCQFQPGSLGAREQGSEVSSVHIYQDLRGYKLGRLRPSLLVKSNDRFQPTGTLVSITHLDLNNKNLGHKGTKERAELIPLRQGALSAQSMTSIDCGRLLLLCATTDLFVHLENRKRSHSGLLDEYHQFDVSTQSRPLETPVTPARQGHALKEAASMSDRLWDSCGTGTRFERSLQHVGSAEGQVHAFKEASSMSDQLRDRYTL
ncbi:hypothetical protein RRG08_064072 [Elysia crispata]|uniref:Uncharacterized protein n=1 Tax=Elysia crispata TaxID=231223 RepID=A0AAE0YF73_9GAST|nr:hypothetical protein RRG08_064072 [Elysia crispata]